MPSDPIFNILALQENCVKLQHLLEEYSTIESDAALCLRELAPLFNQILTDQITAPRKGAAPCGYYFHEGSLRKHASLEDEYANFSMSLQGWDTSSLQKLLPARTAE